MASTWEQIFRDSLSLSGVLGTGQIINDQLLSDAKARAKNLLDELDGEGIALPVFSTEIEFDTVSGQSEYVLGTGDDSSPASPIRPETIIDAQIRITPGAQPVYLPLEEITFPQYRNNILVPKTPSQPFNFAVNPGWPQATFFLWPTPSQVWQIRLTAKITWIDTVGDPNANVYAFAQLPSGYTNAFTNMLALRLAEWKIPNAPTMPFLERKASQGKFVMMAHTWKQRANQTKSRPSAFPWNVTTAGMNP